MFCSGELDVMKNVNKLITTALALILQFHPSNKVLHYSVTVYMFVSQTLKNPSL